MNSLFLKRWNVFIRYHEIPGKGETLVFLPGLNFPSIINFFPTVMPPKMWCYTHRKVVIGLKIRFQ